MYLVALFVITLMSAMMDADYGIANYCKKKGWMKLYEFWDSDSWENKYNLQEWFLKHGFQPWFARFMAMDVLVIFCDGWHLCKAIMFGIIEAFVAVNTIDLLPIQVPVILYWCFLFIITGSVFNFLYYKLRKL